MCILVSLFIGVGELVGFSVLLFDIFFAVWFQPRILWHGQIENPENSPRFLSFRGWYFWALSEVSGISEFSIPRSREGRKLGIPGKPGNLGKSKFVQNQEEKCLSEVSGISENSEFSIPRSREGRKLGIPGNLGNLFKIKRRNAYSEISGFSENSENEYENLIKN